MTSDEIEQIFKSECCQIVQHLSGPAIVIGGPGSRKTTTLSKRFVIFARGLSLRHDHGSQYVSDHFQNEIKFLGIASSPAFVREPEGNACAERFIRTLKENLLWVRTFQSVEELRQALLEFKDIYNQQWIIERLGYRTPAQARQDACIAVEIAA